MYPRTFIFFYLLAAAAVPGAYALPLHALILCARDNDVSSASPSRLQESVIKLIVIGLVLFFVVLLSLYLYRQCKLNGRRSGPAYQLPTSTIIGRDSSRRRWRPYAGAPASSAPPLVRVTTSTSEEGVGLVTLARVPKAHLKSRITAPTAGSPPL
ncbi:hypothetical protein GALMADRAFT_220539 [Galerina marginata CBS 339.88]|uniref:Uncharacterized protein n=1 Tax=Galerina marginata (strain CBS 339.88) TaxID=685588 RepID=A0A067THE6_GALM3|nr:hypothetical protein GALMADRAFT_220539 [Galerina marginata CBS 339.88]